MFQQLAFLTFSARLELTGIVNMRTGESEGSCRSEVREKHVGRVGDLSSCADARWLVRRHWLRLKEKSLIMTDQLSQCESYLVLVVGQRNSTALKSSPEMWLKNVNSPRRVLTLTMV